MEHRLVLHAFAEDPDVLTAALRVARHSFQGLGLDVSVQVVVQGGAVRGLVANSAYQDDLLTTIAGSGVDVLACSNSMERIGVGAEALLPDVGTVPAAVTYLTQQQWAGAAYVRI
ncbi:DsrE family protein [Curtobacterium flaccumfaciens]|jgi:hypothetical protein|uniref:DsrE family protein n=1 Tax=Curtobacterium flaccumfaciens TaxID=2035 RepID=UPI001E549442|nr:DsrE family protein [Curtobacterium allii]MCE0459497.1 DsrE family protein [Curtobacterium allii]